MNTLRPIAVIATLAAALSSGCHGLQGVRYHEGEICEDCGIGGYGRHQQLAEAEGPAETPAPHPKFHPVPTRPVFEPTEEVVGTRPVRHSVIISATDDPVPTLVDEVPSEVTVGSKSAAIAMVSANQRADLKPATSKGENEAEVVVTSSRRQAEVEVTTESDSIAAPRPFTPVDATPLPTKQSSNDMWRPRVQ